MLLAQRRSLAPEGDRKSIPGLLLRCNANAAPEDRLSDEELLAQIDAFLFAGSDSTSVVMVWTLHELSLNPDVQKALRAELRPLNLSKNYSEQDLASDSGTEFDLSTPDPTSQFAAIDALPLLDRVVREVLRLHLPTHDTLRVAEEDDIVPFTLAPRMADGSVSGAVVTGKGADGVERTGIKIRKGEFIRLPFEGMNTAREVWGEDGHEFK